MTNIVILDGRLGGDPELRYTPDGIPVATFRVAVNRPPRDKETQPVADWFTCVAWRKLGETVGNHLTKGRRVLIQGRLQFRQWEASDGTKRSAVEVVAQSVQFLDRPKDGSASSGASGDEPADLPDDLPF